jgi:arginase family enzyme
VDADVLDDAIMPAVEYRIAGGSSSRTQRGILPT